MTVPTTNDVAASNGAAVDRALEGDFSLSLWIDVPEDGAGAAGGLVAKYDPVSRTGFTLSAISSAGGYNGPSDEVRIAFGIDAGTEPRWIDCGRPSPTSNYVSNSLTVHDGFLFAATSDAPDPHDRAHVFRHQGAARWEDLGQVGTEGARGVGPLIVHRAALYAATWNYDWMRVDEEDPRPCHVYRFDGPGRWEHCGQPGRSRRLFGLGSYRGDLYVVGDDFTCHVYRGGATWEPVGTFPTYAHPLTVHEGRLVVGTLDPGSVRAFDGERWEALGEPEIGPLGSTQVHSLIRFGGRLCAGTWPAGRVAAWDAARRRWRDLGRLGDSTEINALTLYNGKLYGGSIPRGEVFRYETGRTWTRIRRFFGPPGWQPIRISRVFTTPGGVDRQAEWTRVTSLTQHDGHLFASIGSCTSAAIDAPADIRGTVHAMRVGAVATTSRPLSPGRHHVVAVRAGGRVSIWLDGHEAAGGSGPVSGSIANSGPLTIGSDESGPFAGVVRHVRVLSRPLTSQEIAAAAANLPADDPAAHRGLTAPGMLVNKVS
jgi:Concanavalin A-like lectin/glucanases superfamily